MIQSEQCWLYLNGIEREFKSQLWTPILHKFTSRWWVADDESAEDESQLLVRKVLLVLSFQVKNCYNNFMEVIMALGGPKTPFQSIHLPASHPFASRESKLWHKWDKSKDIDLDTYGT